MRNAVERLQVEKRERKSKGEKKSRGINKKEQVCVLVARDRTKATVMKVACMGRITKPKVEKLIGSKLSSDNVFVTDAWRGFMTYAKDKRLEHYRLKSDGTQRVIKGIYHIQNVNSLHSRIKDWMREFKGVATKYLNNYLSWFLFVDNKSNEATNGNIKEFLLSSFVFDMSDTFESIRKSKLVL